MIVIGYVLLGFLIVLYVSILFQIWEHKRNAKTEWQKYWDEVFEKNKYLKP